MLCPHCGGTASDGARFCPHCGRALEDPEVTLAATGQATVPPSSPKPSSSSGWLTSSDSISHGRFAPGAVLDGRYRVIALVGRGGMGEVYRADDLRLGQPVALKFLPDAVGADSSRLAQFHNEVRTARQVSHPNICRVYDIGEVEGHLFLSMELVAGEDLATSLRRIGRFPEDKATDIARQLCAGLASAHERGVLHRDLKPANVMLDDAGNVRLMDFGLAAMGSVDNVRAGTPGYMAPEQLLGKEVTARSDIYALGLVLYELYTGRRAFTAATLNELVEQHQSGQVTPPRTIVGSIDPAIERAILRCLDPDPARRPSSALAVSAALPGGDPLAAALAAGETPSPEMVAAAGEGAGLSRRVAVPVYAAVLVGVAVAYALALRNSPIDRLRPELNGDVLAQKARDVARQLGYTDRPRDEAFAFTWETAAIDDARRQDKSAAAWMALLEQRPSPLQFWYRRSQDPMTGLQFHHDLLTPGIVSPDDPAPIESGMIRMTLDHQGLLMAFEAIPPQVEESPPPPSPPDWNRVLTLAGLDPTKLQTASPQWNWLASPDTRAAWIGTWPGNERPVRVEAAALHGRPVAFQVVGPWTKPWRTPSAETTGETGIVAIIFSIAFAILLAANVLARKSLREGRGDRKGALALARFVAIALWIVWICQAHLTPSIGTLGIALLAVCTTTFYGVLFWAIYLALEPFVRRHWPHSLVSWTTLLGGRVRDQVVGRDVLFGVALGVAIALLVRASVVYAGGTSWAPTELLDGVRSTAGEIVGHALYAMRTALFVFFLLFLLRVLVRNQWVAALAFGLLFAVLDVLDSDTPWLEGSTTFLYFMMFAVAVLRWGLTTLTIGVLVADLLLIVQATTDLSAWYIAATVIVVAIPVALASWAFYTSVGGRLWTADLLK